jgi:predicted nucleic acid-binding protein
LIKAVCLDTRILSAFLKKKESAKNIINEFKDKGYEIYTTTINITEIFMGLFKISIVSEEKINIMKAFFLALHPRTIDYEICVLSGKLYASILKGREIGWRDTFIAAITLLNGKMIITSNPEHFKRISDLEAIEYY